MSGSNNVEFVKEFVEFINSASEKLAHKLVSPEGYLSCAGASRTYGWPCSLPCDCRNDAGWHEEGGVGSGANGGSDSPRPITGTAAPYVALAYPSPPAGAAPRGDWNSRRGRNGRPGVRNRAWGGSEAKGCEQIAATLRYRREGPASKGSSHMAPSDAPRLSTYPDRLLVIACAKCGRRGSYAVGRLRERFGDATMIQVRETLSADCNRRGSSNTTDYCGAVFEW
jgi:hypothetical protein